MANKTINTRISLKYDTYENWHTNNPTPLKGELCIVVIPAATNAVASEPCVLTKTGDGENAFNDLTWNAGLAADVYSWAKEKSKPAYAATEITGLDTYISGKVQDTDTQYQIVEGDTEYAFKLQSKPLGGNSWADVSTITIPEYDDSTLSGKVSALETLVGSTAVATQIATAIKAVTNGASINTFKDVETALAKKQNTGDYATKTEAKGYADAKDTAIADAKEAGTDAQAAVDAIKDGKSIDSFADVEAELAKKQATGDYATKAQAQAYADAKDTAIADAKAAGTAAQSAVDELAEKVGDVDDGKTVVQLIEEAKTAATYDDSALTARVAKNESAITTLNGTGAGSVKKTAEDAATAAINKFAAEISEDETVNTFKELVDWVADHGSEAEEMAAGIQQNQSDISALKTQVGTGTVDSRITTAINNEKTRADGAYATKTQMTAAEGRITTVEGTLKTKANTADLHKIATSGDINDLEQASGYVVFNCGSATENI